MSKLRRHVDLKIVFLDGKRVSKRVSAGANMHIGDNALEHLLTRASDDLERMFPKKQFRLAPLRGSAFNFIEVQVPVMEEAPA